MTISRRIFRCSTRAASPSISTQGGNLRTRVSSILIGMFWGRYRPSLDALMRPCADRNFRLSVSFPAPGRPHHFIEEYP